MSQFTRKGGIRFHFSKEKFLLLEDDSVTTLRRALPFQPAEAPKYKDFILPLIFTKRLCDVFDDELNRIADRVGSRAKAFKLVEMDKKLVRFYLPLKPENTEDSVWSVIRQLTDSIGEQLTNYLRAIALDNPSKKLYSR